MTKKDATRLLHVAMWSLADNRELFGAWQVEDVYMKLDLLSREDRLAYAGILRAPMRKAAAIHSATSRRVTCFLIWVLESVEGP